MLDNIILIVNLIIQILVAKYFSPLSVKYINFTIIFDSIFGLTGFIGLLMLHR